MKTILKLTLSFGIIFWLIQSGKLNFNLVNQLLQDPLRVIISLIGCFIILFIVTYRWKIIVETKAQKNLPMIPILKGNWIGMFFNAVLPGSVSGDFIKVFYLEKLDPKFTKGFLILSSLVDRVIGLFGIIFLLGSSALIFYQDLSTKNESIKQLLTINLALVFLIILGITLLFLNPKFITQLLKKLPFSKQLNSLWSFLLSIRDKIFKLLFLSVIIQAGAVIIFWYLTYPFAEGDFTLGQAFSFIPIGFVVIAIPIAPSGLGVGHVMFDELFKLYQINNGASLFNLYFLIQLLCNLVGVIPYITFKAEQSEKETTR